MTVLLENPLKEEQSKCVSQQNKIRNASEGSGLYFTANKNLAEGYGEAGACFLNIREPANLTKSQQFFNDLRSTATDVFGIDGYHSQYGKGSGTWVAFTPNQVESDTDNIGTYDSATSSISFSLTSHETLDQVKENWRKLLDRYKAGSITDKNRFLRIAPTPAVLQMLGAKALDLSITVRILNKVTKEKHTVPLEELERLPEAISDPIMVFESKTVANSMVVLTEMKEGAHNVIVAVHLDKKVKSHVTINNIASLYGKDNPAALFQQKLLYLNNEKSRKWIQDTRAPIAIAKSSFHSPEGASNIKTPSDLANWKNQKNLPDDTF